MVTFDTHYLLTYPYFQMATFQIFKSAANNQFYFRLRATGNNEIILNSEGYATKQGATGGITSVKTNSKIDAQYERRSGTGYSFVLKAGNGEIIGRSESYTSETARENGINLVKRDAADASVVDQS